VPDIDRTLLAPNILVMEYVPGVKINNADAIDAMGLDRDRLARLTVESYLQQLLRHGLFPADPHPGNVACDSVNGGRLIYYDFGMMGRIQPFVRCAPAARGAACMRGRHRVAERGGVWQESWKRAAA
jgi:predicted unusual protein kinase regulating ubiquinone biosynthesis (AarF/ABC1/UbiB family)